MAKMNSPFKYMYDAAPEAAVVAKDHVAKTATFNGAAFTLDTLHGHWTSGELADTTFPVVVNVEALDKTTGDETYTLELEFGPAGFGSSIKPQKLVVAAPGQYVFLVDIDTLKAVKNDIAAFRLVGTLAGTTPSITLHAFIGGAIAR